MAKYPGQPIEAIESAVERDRFFGAHEAKDFGLVDEVFDKRPAPGEGDATHQAEAA
jgi:ATP-dependent Clp protease protease subunit